MRAAIALLALSLGGCIASEAFPTVIDNQSRDPIVMQYHERGYENWSAFWTIPPGEAQSLAREHWVQDIFAIRIRDGNRAFSLSDAQLQSIRNNCGNSFLTRRLKLAPDCYITYFGNGRLAASTRVPPGIDDRLNKNLEPAQSSSSS